MKLLVSLLLAATASVLATVATAEPTKCFPDDFLFGSATAAYQVEGGWNATGRTPSVWDDYCRAEPSLQCANVADDFVHRYESDIALMADTGLTSFRFSVSWSRVMNWDPSVKRMKPNAPGIAFYHAVVDTLLAKGITPIITLYHWDLPRELESDVHGWLNPALGDHFTQYAELMFTEFGTKVDFWSTFNEPWSFTTDGYCFVSGPPALPPSDTNVYKAAHNVLIAHGLVVKRFRELKDTGVIHAGAKISIVLNTDYSYPLDPNNAADVAAADRRMQFSFGWFLQPIVSGEYPAVMRERVGERLPTFTDDEKKLVVGSYDLFMLNHYASKSIVDCASPLSTIECTKLALGWERDMGIDESRMPDGARPSSLGPNGESLCVWFSAHPQGYRDTIRWMHEHNKSTPILLTENGWCGNATIDNQDQLWYFQTFLAQVHAALTEDKIPIVGYTAWSFLDNYEWGSFAPRFGLYFVNFTAETGAKNGFEPQPTDLARIPRTAAKWYAEVAKSKCLDGGSEKKEEKVAVAAPLQQDESSTTGGPSTLTMLVVPVVAVGAAAVLLLRRRRRRAGTTGETTSLLGQQ